ncbi:MULTISPECIES: 2OG-Fe(II) oxygenase [Kordiimonas]|uniref:2OG-Fe(II) oxygenase n=1 Tax=Kordiimonas TaxID=288021 RepID=UPI002580D207|nr:2OG-Fe(II) oxygenase [Kordiimonas sp. UBA4487]
MAESVDINQLAVAANAGDADAQYKMAAYLSGEGQKDAAIKMLKAAATAGHLDARFTLANFMLSGHMVDRDVNHAVQVLAQAAAKGHEAATRLLAVLKAMGHGCEADWPAAVALLVSGARQGHILALAELALLRELYGFNDDLNTALLLAAATRGNIIAAMQLVSRHLKGDRTIEAGLAKQWTQQGRQLGHPLAGNLLPAFEAVEAAPLPDPTALPDIPEDLLSDLATAPESLARPQARVELDRPHVETIEGLISHALCEHIIAASAPSLAPARVVDPKSGELRADPYRHSYNMTFWPADLDLVLYAIGARMCAAAGVTPDHGEMLSVLYYQPGMYYGPHYDCLVPGADGQNAELERSGQRPKTVLIYLNDGYEGGSTSFVRAGFAHKGGIGDAIVFQNVLADGEIDEQSLHESTPVTGGVKWIASKWIREKSYQF